MSFQNNIFYNKVKDNSVSNEIFDLHYNAEYDMLITFPKPSLEKLPSYYESDDYISHTDGKRSVFEIIYQLVKRHALKNKLKLINSVSSSRQLLDIGAGTGDFLLTAQKNGWNTTGIEPNEKAKKIAQNKGISFVESLSLLPNHSFDVITMWHVLEHVPDLDIQLNELKRLIKPDGTIIIAVPNFKSFDAKYYQEFWAAFDVPRHLWHFSKKAIQKLFKERQMEVVKIVPMKWDSFYVSLLSEKYKNGSMNFLKAFWIGFKSNQYAKEKMEYSSHIYLIKNT